IKPFSMRELSARIRVQLRRIQQAENRPDTLTLGETTIDFVRKTCRGRGKPIELTAKELSMLQFMASTPNEPVTREQFLDVVWGYGTFPTTRTVDNHIASLRHKLEPDPARPRWIKTVHCVGYKLALDFAKP
ncbi:MAG: response regulator transcription factor, partial [Verrucomicrobiota bacterium]